MTSAVHRRIGVMVPSTNTTCESDFTLVVPRGVTVHGQRLWMTNEANGDDADQRMNAEIETGARYLATAKVDVVVYGCTTGSFYRGPGWDREMLVMISREAGVPAVATTPSVVDALERRTGRPVVASNQATIWASLRALRLVEPIRGFGRLLERLATV
jgi:maleate cis-trans isomerase